jgi:predicted dehydrogenase
VSKVVMAVIGAGVMGTQHARVIAGSDDAVLGVIVDADIGRARALAERFAARPSADLSDALRCDGAVVSTSTESHVTLALALIDAGVPVLVEKPLAAGIGDARALLGASADRSVPISCGFVERHNPAVRTAIEQLDGPVRHMVALRHSPPAGRAMSTVVWDLLIHDLDLALVISGFSTFDVAGVTPDPADMADDVDCLLTAPGCRVALSASRSNQRKIRTWQITSDDLTIELDLVRQNVTTFRHRSHAVGSGVGYRAETSIDIPYIRHGGEPLELQFRHFLRLISGEVDAATERASLLPAHQLAAVVCGDVDPGGIRQAARVAALNP